MKHIIIILLSLNLLLQSCNINGQTKEKESKLNESKQTGFLFVKISNINRYGGNVCIINDNDTIISFNGKKIFIDNKEYDIIDEEYKYKKFVNIETLDAEYGLFILKCYSSEDDSYKVEINGAFAYIPKEVNNQNIEFKDFEAFILDTYPIPNNDNPILKNPSESSESVDGFINWTYKPVEIKGDWLKVIDNKDCYFGTAPAPNPISGWIRWRKDGEFILKVAHTC